MNLLAVQGLGLSTSTRGGRGSIPGWGSKSCMPCDLAKKKKKKVLIQDILKTVSLITLRTLKLPL